MKERSSYAGRDPSAIAATLGARLMDQEPASLNEIFVGYAGVPLQAIAAD